MNTIRLECAAASGQRESYVLTYPDGSTLSFGYDTCGVGFSGPIFMRGSGCAPLAISEANERKGFLHSCHHFQTEGDARLEVQADGKTICATRGVNAIRDRAPEVFQCREVVFQTEATLGRISRIQSLTRATFHVERPLQFESICRHAWSRDTTVSTLYHQLLAMVMPGSLYVCGTKKNLPMTAVSMKNGVLVKNDVPGPLTDGELSKKYGDGLTWCKYHGIHLPGYEKGLFYVNSEENFVGFTTEESCDYYLYNVPEGPDLYYGLYLTWIDRTYRAREAWESRAVCHWGRGMNKVAELLSIRACHPPAK